MTDVNGNVNANGTRIIENMINRESIPLISSKSAKREKKNDMKKKLHQIFCKEKKMGNKITRITETEKRNQGDHRISRA